MVCSLCHVLLVVLIHIRPQASLRTSSLDFGPESGYQITRWHLRVCILDSCFSCLRKIHKLCICSLFVLCQTGCIRVLKWNFLTPKIIDHCTTISTFNWVSNRLHPCALFIHCKYIFDASVCSLEILSLGCWSLDCVLFDKTVWAKLWILKKVLPVCPQLCAKRH